MTAEEILAYKNNYKNQIKQTGKEGVISDEVVLNFFESLNNVPEKDRTEVQKALNKDFSNYNNLNKFYTNCLAIKAVTDMEKIIGLSNMNFENPNLVNYLKENVMDCALHKGLSILKETKPYLTDIEKNFNRMLLEKTLQTPTEESQEKVLNELGQEKGKDVLSKNLEKQKIMAKTLFMAQIGKYDLKQKNSENPIEYDGLISETIVHGGRTNFILPYGYNQEKVMNSLYGEEPENTAELKSRSAATHYVNRQKMNEDGSIKSKSVEESPWSTTLHKVLPKQFGMNIAVGGIGETGPDNKTILPNGSAGHMYVRKELGDKNTCGSLLVGFESADSGATSYTGHKHDFLAKSAQQSAFLADKNLVGKKTDGRMVDLSGLSPEQFEKIMNEFDRVYSTLQKSEDSAQLEKLNHLLTGKRVGEKELIKSLTELSFNKYVLEDTILPARMGFEARINIAEDKIIAPSQNELLKWKDKLDDFTKELKIDLDNPDDLKKMFAVEKVGNKFVTNPLFNDNHITAKDYYKRMKSVNLNGGKIFAFKNGESKAQKIVSENGEFKLVDAKANITKPNKPNLAKRILNAITFGKAYKNELSKYQADLQNFKKENEIEQLVSQQEDLRKADAENELISSSRIPLDSEKLKKDLGMEKVSPNKSEPVAETSKTIQTINK